MENVCNYLAEKELFHCCINANKFTDVDRTVSIDIRGKQSAKFIKVDGCVITGSSQKKCDCLVLYKKNKSKLNVFYVELKGGSADGSYVRAIEQLENTIKHENVRAIIDSHEKITISKLAVIHAGFGMMTNRPHVDEVSDQLGMRLYVHKAKQNEKALDLKSVLKKINDK